MFLASIWRIEGYCGISNKTDFTGDNPLNFMKRIFTGMKQEAEPESSVMAEEVEKSTVAEVSQPEPEPQPGAG